METGTQAQDTLRVWLHDRSAVIRVEGRGSFKLAAALREFVDSAMAGGAGRVILDAEGCVGMDSTFMGVIAGMALRMKSVEGGRVLFVNASERALRLLATLGLNRFVEVHPAGSLPGGLEDALRPPDGARNAASGPAPPPGTLLEAHEDLVRLDPSNLDRFRDVLVFLRRDVERNASGPGA